MICDVPQLNWADLSRFGGPIKQADAAGVIKKSFNAVNCKNSSEHGYGYGYGKMDYYIEEAKKKSWTNRLLLKS